MIPKLPPNSVHIKNCCGIPILTFRSSYRKLWVTDFSQLLESGRVLGSTAVFRFTVYYKVGK